MTDQTADDQVAALLRAHWTNDGPSVERLLDDVVAADAGGISRAWIRIASRLLKALPRSMADELLGAPLVQDEGSDLENIALAWNQATTFLSQAAHGVFDPASLRLVMERNPYFPAQLLRAVMAFGLELPEEAVTEALGRLADRGPLP